MKISANAPFYFVIACTTIFSAMLLSKANADTDKKARVFSTPGLTTVTSKTFDKEISTCKTPVFLFACSSKLAPCHRMSTTVVNLYKAHKNEMKFVQMDPLESELLTKRYGVRAYPACVLMLPESKFQYAHNIIIGPASQEFLEAAVLRTMSSFSVKARDGAGSRYDDIVIFKEIK